jgi:hypothetical protein
MKCLITLNDGTSESVESSGGDIANYLHDLKHDGRLKSYRVLDEDEEKLTANVPPTPAHNEQPLGLPTWNDDDKALPDGGLRTRRNAHAGRQQEPLELPKWEDTKPEENADSTQNTKAAAGTEKPLPLPTW